MTLNHTPQIISIIIIEYGEHLLQIVFEKPLRGSKVTERTQFVIYRQTSQLGQKQYRLKHKNHKVV